MKSKMSKKKIDNGKASAIFQQMKTCLLELGLKIHSEAASEGEMGMHAKLDIEDVRAAFSLLYYPKDGSIALLALHYDLTDYEWDAVQWVIPKIYKQHEAIEACASPETGLVGYMAELTVEHGSLDVLHFRQVLSGLVKMSRCISSFVCGLRDRQEKTGRRTPEDRLN